MTAILGLPQQPASSLYATSRYGRAQRRSAEVGVVRRRLWALRILAVAWMVGSAVTMWLVVTWCGWPTAVFTHTPMAVFLIALLHVVRVERRWLARLRADARP
ncbi:hypothetical protein [Actinoplanes sp. NPDC049316]|uniref:hypothetical protein n=1 Tax=Actinoplanes sp. NPDC049316 TaxID=3154727 RepID=UPI003443F241